jgi:hypothetical protein
VKPEIIFQYSPWWIVLCLLLGLGYAMFFYFNSKFEKKFKWVLAILRGLLVSLLAFLLLNPLMKYITSTILKPSVVVLFDDSQSMKFGGENLLKDLKTKVFEVQSQIKAKDFDCIVLPLSSDKVIEAENDLKFENRKTNISTAFQNLKSNYEGQNLSDVVLISDGILNDGVSPTFSKYPFAVHTVGFGDTTAKKDIKINGITANKIAYLGSKFSVNADISAYGFANQADNIVIKDSKGVILAKKDFAIGQADYFSSISFELQANKAGKARYIVEVGKKQGEFSTLNNTKEIVIEVVDGKEKILVLAAAPHPDLKALRSILDKNSLFETTFSIQPTADAKDPFDILILHHLPDVQGAYSAIVQRAMAKNKPVLYFVGSKTNFTALNSMQSVFSITTSGNKLDKATPIRNALFQKFQLNNTADDIFSKMPPLIVPFGEYKLNTGAENILLQKVVNVPTPKTLLGINVNSEKKSAVFVGEGLWQWRLEEYALTENQVNIDELILKTLQLISLKEDKSKLRIYPISETFNVDESIQIAAETYNNLYEKIFDQNINVKINGEKGFAKTFNFQNSKDQSSFTLAKLPAGIYTYSATATILGKTETTNGQFVVSQNDTELSNSTADFSLLKTISAANNGKFLPAASVSNLVEVISKNNLTNKLSSSEELKDLVNIKWILALLLLLASLEWVARKYFGQY